MTRLFIGILVLFGVQAWASPPGQKTYDQFCAGCHGQGRLGGMGAALLPENLSRLKKAEAASVIADGRPGIQMPPYRQVLSAAQIGELVELIYTPVTPVPSWTEADIRASRVVHHASGSLPAAPQFTADPLNLFVVVEAGDSHVTILDGDRLEPIHRFASRFALHGGPKFTRDGRYVYFASRDGWISKFDLWNLKTVAEVRAGINTRNAAVSSDGRYVMVANYLPHTLTLLDADLNLVKVIPAASRISAVYDAPPRSSFIAALKDVPEVWEISYDPKAEPIPTGLVHDFRLKEGSFVPGFLNPRRTPLTDVLDDFFFTPDFSTVVGAQRDGKRGRVVQLDVRREIASVDLPGLPHLGSGISWERDGRRVMATPNLREGVVSVIDVQTWKPVAQVTTLGPGFFLRSHEATRYAWVDSMMSPKGRDTLQVIDKQTLEVAARLTPEPGKTLAHIEFDRYGRYALASLWEQEGALIVFDARTLAEVKRIPMKKPVGKYNVYNKIMRSEGTSP
ncbi:MAG: cytochrome C oxidase Cbb3 [Betaproteobacteria bacterium RIFCSPLOWO2_12_FULL_65_14]|nr:MAG: cytochrome C oxidase Cbb3 [Betaproteobacteria bacterium RIFCSPLOWO2_12_FULL_65_14]